MNAINIGWVQKWCGALCHERTTEEGQGSLDLAEIDTPKKLRVDGWCVSVWDVFCLDGTTLLMMAGGCYAFMGK